MPPASRFILAIALFAAPLLHAQEPNGGQAQSLPEVQIHIGAAVLAAEVASTPREGEIGLMYRSSMPDNHGMLFQLKPGTQMFWMKNTLIPLSIAFLDKDGTILEIHDMKALDEHITRSDSDQVAYAIEANLHWFDLNGIKPGVKVSPSPVEAVHQATIVEKTNAAAH